MRFSASSRGDRRGDRARDHASCSSEQDQSRQSHDGGLTPSRVPGILALPSSTSHTPNRFTLELVESSYTDPGPRLFLRIRAKLGQAHYIGAMDFMRLVPDSFAFRAGTEPQTAALVAEETPAEAELLRANGLIGFPPDWLQSPSARDRDSPQDSP